MNIREQTIVGFNNHAQWYHDTFMEFDLYNDTYDFFISALNQPNAKLLELGCGPGNITHYLLNKQPNYSIDATDLAPAMLQKAKQNNPTANCFLLDCMALSTLPNKYDGIVNGFCMPYLSKEECLKFIKDASSQLNPNGVLYFSIIEGDYTKSGVFTTSDGKSEYRIFYHEADYLQEALTQNGFELLRLFRKPYPNKTGGNDTHAIFIARKI